MSNTDKKGIIPIAGQDNTEKQLDVLFIHGLGGDAFSTWQFENNENYFWPKALHSDFPDAAIWTIGYGATASSWIEDVMPMENRVENLLNQLSLKGIGKKPFILITHSMGGLIAKYLLTQAAQSNDKSYQQFADQCAGVVFLAVPHHGSGWSTLLNYARVLVRGNQIVDQLAKDDPALHQLDKNFGQFCKKKKLDCYAFIETKEVRLKKKLFGIPLLAKGIKVVSESSASSSFLTKPPVPLDDDHLSICKVESKNDQLYENMIEILQNSLDSIRKKTAISLEEETKQETPPIKAKKVKVKKTKEKTLFLLFHLKQQNDQIISINEYVEQTSSISDLIPFNNSSAQQQAMAIALLGDQKSWQKTLQTVATQNDISDWKTAKIRIRIMTDDPQIAMLPWHCIKTSQFNIQAPIIEISPPLTAVEYQTGFISHSPSDPLCVIPANPHDGISGDSHYRIIEENFKSYFDIQRNIPRVFTPSQLQREIGFIKPDIIYIYARYENETFLLDTDYANGEPLTLDQLAQWLSENGLKPIIILSLIGAKINQYPESLIKNSRLLWIQQTRSKLTANLNLSDNIANVFSVSNQNPDIIQTIQKIDLSPNDQMHSHLWINGRSIKVKMSDPEQSGKRQLRAALLRILLGRENIKNAMYGQIFHSDIINNSSFLSYAVTGDNSACPFDFPAQLQQRLQYEDLEHSLKVIPYYFNIDVKEAYEAYDTIETALEQGILNNSNDITEIFNKAVKNHDECCINLNWLFKVSQENQRLIKQWLIEWRGIQCSWFINKIPDQTVLVSAICIQIEQSDSNSKLAQETQDLANEILDETETCQIETIYVQDALGKLKAQEITSFLRKNPYWQEQLEFKENNIDLRDYANWVYKQHNGEFDASIRTIWKQSQNQYQEYLKNASMNN